MAEARSVALVRRNTLTTPEMQFSVSSDGFVLKIDRGAISALGGAIRRSINRSYYDLRSSFLNGVWPMTPGHWGFTVGTSFSMMNIDSLLPHAGSTTVTSGMLSYPFIQRAVDLASNGGMMLWRWESYIPFRTSTSHFGRSLIFSIITGTALTLFVANSRRFFLRGLLSYRGWLFEQPRQQGLLTLLWGSLVRFFSGRNQMTYCNQQALPRMHVPSLRGTVTRYLESMQPLQTPEEFEITKANANTFLASEGPRLQWYCYLKSWMSDNYVTDWWEKYVYLMGRESIMINSNYYALDHQIYLPTKSSCSRLACVIYEMMEFKKLIERESLPPLVIRSTVPMCMSQYRRMFGTTRVPGRELDTLEHYGRSSKYIVVNHKGIWYSLEMFHRDNTPLTVYEIEAQLKLIVENHGSRGTKPPTEAEVHLGALTAANRTVWAEARADFFSAGQNRYSLDIIEKSIFTVVISEDSPVTHSEQGHALIHGHGYDRWFDKSITLVGFANGRVGLNLEHSWADAPVIAHMWEHVMYHSNENHQFNARGYIQRPASSPPTKVLPSPVRLRWNLSAEAEVVIAEAVAAAKLLIEDFDLEVITHNDYGKGYIKKAHMSPDGYLQMALQLAYYKNTGDFPLTYESSMTRLYRDGRTETVRPVSDESCKFVLAMCNPSSSKEERVECLKNAVERHQTNYRLAMSGQGIDRHLFALYIVSKGLKIESAFLKSALSQPWRLSTSQQPQRQTTFWNPDIPESLPKISPGGGFGPVADDGYGVSYMIGGDHVIFFHISSKVSSPATSSMKFAASLRQSLSEMKVLFL